MHKDVYFLERLTLKENIINKIDARIKLITTLIIVLYANLVSNIISLIILESFLLTLILLSGRFFDIIKRILIVLPFGVFLSFFQPFIRGEKIIYTIFGIHIYYDGLIFGITLFLKFLVCITAVMLLSSTTPMYKVISAARKIGLPNIMALLLGLMVRYLFLMYDILRNTIIAQKSRCFNRKNLKYKEVMKIFGYTVGTLFIRAYEQGERTYLAMCARGYNENSSVEFYNNKISLYDIIYLLSVIFIIIVSYLVSFIYS